MKNKFAVVTGASSGIGYELAKQFAENGFDLLVVAEDAGIVEAAQVFSQCGTQVESLRTDLATYNGVEELFMRIQNSHRSLDAVAINAGVGVGGASFDKTDLQAELNLIQLNVVHPVHLTKRILPIMIEQGYGRILYTSSIAAFMPGPFESVYSASKAFLQSFTEAIRNETKEKGISITSLMPGPTETNFFHRAGMDETKVGHKKKDDPADVAKIGFDALMAGKENVFAASWSTKFQGQMAKQVPQSVAAEFHKTMTLPDSPEDR